MMSPDDLDRLIPAERLRFRSPIPLQPVSSEEFTPGPQTPTQRRLQSRLQQLGEELARHQGLSRRAFFQSAAGMAAAFVAMNEAYGRAQGPLYDASLAEAADPARAAERARSLRGQFIMDMHTHFLR